MEIKKVKKVFLLVALCLSCSVFSQENGGCFPRAMTLEQLALKTWNVHLFKDKTFSLPAYIKLDYLVHIHNGVDYEKFDYLINDKINPKLLGKIDFIKINKSNDWGVFFCPSDKPNEFIIENMDIPLYFKSDWINNKEGSHYGVYSFTDPNEIRNLLLKNLEYQKVLKNFNDCLDKQGEDCAKKDDERSAKLLLYMVDGFNATDCKKEMPTVEKFDPKKKYSFQSSVIEKAKSIMNTNREFSVKYYLNLNSSKFFEYNFSMYASFALKCRNWNLEGIDVSYKLDKDEKGYFKLISPSEAVTSTDYMDSFEVR